MLVKYLLILGIAAIGSSFTLPGGLANGLYQAHYNSAGEEVHELVTAGTLNTTSLPTPPDPEPSLSKRQAIAKRWDSTRTWCGCAFPMNAGDTNVANAGLASWAASSPSIGNNVAEYYIQNTAIAFVIYQNPEGYSSTNVPYDLVSNNSPDVSYACGNFIAGTSQLNWFYLIDDGLYYGYMNYFSGLNLFDSYAASTQSTCPDSAAGQCQQCYDSCDSFNGSGESCSTVCNNCFDWSG